MTWGADNHADRNMGAVAERECARHFQLAGFKVEHHPYGVIGPDLHVWSRYGRGNLFFDVEVRCKYPTPDEMYGLEENKLKDWCEREVLYIIKDRSRLIWCGAQMADLGEPVKRGKPGSYRRGRMDYTLRNVFWPIGWWMVFPWPYGEP